MYARFPRFGSSSFDRHCPIDLLDELMSRDIDGLRVVEDAAGAARPRIMNSDNILRLFTLGKLFLDSIF
jgi:hypothetical protein